MRYLVVAAHPDDEALGAGAFIHRVSKNGNEVYVCLLSHWSPTRDDNLEEGIKKSHDILGVKKTYVGDFGCMRFKDADHHEIVRFIEACIKDCLPEVIITHHPGDIHIDHDVTNECCLEAARLPQRQLWGKMEDELVFRIKKIMLMEVPSSTDWGFNTKTAFIPNEFVEVSEEDVDAKIRAIGVYKEVVRKPPHPRSEKSIQALATVRGSQCGILCAEAFQQIFGLEVSE